MDRRIVPSLVVCCLLCLAAQGCATGRKYAWGEYDAALYRHYKLPQDREAHLEKLKQIVDAAEAEDRVPPGLYAEYGYCLYEIGNPGDAIAYFEKEKSKWPESNLLMEKMIRNARRRQESAGNASSSLSPGGKEGTR
ncbi:MAG TPA: DUF4810 domain-containing protein [Candidatus Aquicultoraceae bacterium]|nr:DUF4810 domain-containing protein [Candidatus Aquicultoraceae bacterium]